MSIEEIANAYEREFHATPVFYECKPSAGAGDFAEDEILRGHLAN